LTLYRQKIDPACFELENYYRYYVSGGKLRLDRLRGSRPGLRTKYYDEREVCKMRKVKILLCECFILLLFLVGCASVSYNTETGEMRYIRVGDQQIEGLKINKTDKGVKVELAGQKSEAHALAEAIRVIGVLAAPVNPAN